MNEIMFYSIDNHDNVCMLRFHHRSRREANRNIGIFIIYSCVLSISISSLFLILLNLQLIKTLGLLLSRQQIKEKVKTSGKMATMPVVWCSDPKSINNKPIAFALHGIQLQGNVTEKQVLALRELVNAAAEGRLILPSDGTFMLLESGISIESSIVKNSKLSIGGNKENIDRNNVMNVDAAKVSENLKKAYLIMPMKTAACNSANVPSTTPSTKPYSAFKKDLPLEPKYSTTFLEPPSCAEGEILYEFLCCAKCMNEGHRSRCTTKQSTPNFANNRKAQFQTLLQRYLKSRERSYAHSRNTLLNDSLNGKGNGKVNDLQQLVCPAFTIANKHARRYQRKHCNISAANIMRNRHNNRHKLPMQSVKAFHNRNACPIAGGDDDGGGGCSSVLTNGLRKAKTTATISKITPLVLSSTVDQQPSSLPPLTSTLALYATVNKEQLTNVEKTLLLTSSARPSVEIARNSKVDMKVKYKKNNDITETCAVKKTKSVNKQRQRKIGAVIGSLQDTVENELENVRNERGQIICDSMDTMDATSGCPSPIVKDLISFEDVEDTKNSAKPMSFASSYCDNNQTVDLLSRPNEDLPQAVATIEPFETIIIERNVNTNTSPPPARSNSSSRKTSFDSTCTISSMDSGFIEMQNKTENSFQTHPSLSSIFNNLIVSSNGDNVHNPSRLHTMDHEIGSEKIARLNYKECLTQSRNRRKSYEEFKALFVTTETAHTDSYSAECKSQVRRKNYQDLRKMLEKEVQCEISFSQPISENIESPMTASTTKTLESISEQETAAAAAAVAAAVTLTKPCAIIPTIQVKATNLTEQKNANLNFNCNRDDGKPDLVNGFNAVPGTSDTNTNTIIIPVDNDNKVDIAVADTLALTTNRVTTTTSSNTTNILRKNSDFLAKILDNHSMTKEKEKAQTRRKSYEEFKRLVRECETTTSEKQPMDMVAPFKRQNSRHRKSYGSFLLTRRNFLKTNDHAKKSASDAAPTSQGNETIAEPKPGSLQLQSRSLVSNVKANSPNAAYKRNLKIYDKLVYGTIYDIIQRKNDIYNLTYQHYDKYMTYGTIYEILRRKTSQTSISSPTTTSLPTSSSSSSSSSSTSTSSCNGPFQLKGLSAILDRDVSKKGKRTDLERLKKSGLIYDIIQKQQQENKPPNTEEHNDANGKDIIQQTAAATNTDNSAIAVVPTCKYSTIYDILQEEKTDATAATELITTTTTTTNEAKRLIKGKNRFVVSRINETSSNSNSSSSKLNDIPAKVVNEAGNKSALKNVTTNDNASNNATKSTKSNKMRRLSNMLSYSILDTLSGGNHAKYDSKAQEMKIQGNNRDNSEKRSTHNLSNLIPLDSDELYTRIAAKRRGITGGQIVKANSLDAISTAVTISPPLSPTPTRRIAAFTQLCAGKKLSYANIAENKNCCSSAKVKDLPKLRRLSNQMSPPHCFCCQPANHNSNDDDDDDDDIIADISNTLEFTFLPKPAISTCSSPLSTNDLIHDCCCDDTFIKTNENMKSLRNADNIMGSYVGGVIEAVTAAAVAASQQITCSGTHSLTASKAADQCPCPCLANRSNCPNSSLASTIIACNSKTLNTTTPAAITVAAKKGKSRRLSEFTRGEFLNEKPRINETSSNSNSSSSKLNDIPAKVVNEAGNKSALKNVTTNDNASNNATKSTKSNKMRRLSNMLSYSILDTLSGGNHAKYDSKAQEMKIQGNNRDNSEKRSTHNLSNLIPLDSDELYTRIAAKRRGITGGQIVKANSLDAISTAVTISPPLSPTPTRRIAAFTQLCAGKKLSYANIAENKNCCSSAKVKDLPKLRRLSNQMSPPHCFCCQPANHNSNDDDDDDDDIIADISNTLEFTFLPKPAISTCSSPLSTNDLIHDCCCDDTFIKTNENMKSLRNADNIMGSYVGGVIEAVTAAAVAASQQITCSGTHSLTASKAADQCPCPCLANRSNCPNSSLASTIIACNSKTLNTTTPAAITVAAKKGKSRRLSEFTRGEFLNEKPCNSTQTIEIENFFRLKT
uniref:Uncharacterized protein n=1 Tax=Glossina palpalis gambiensis TaxID=67801 RepID=A0A1B0AMM3_9MUSC